MPSKHTPGQKRLLREVRAFEAGERTTPYWPQSPNTVRCMEALERKGYIVVDRERKRITIKESDV